jgi:hypothetical protein
MRRGVLALGWTLVLAAAAPARAQSVEGLDPHVSASPGSAPHSLLLHWGARADAVSFTVRRRDGAGHPWTEVATLPGVSTGWEDLSAPGGRTFEYHVQKTPASGPTGNAYVLAGVDVPYPAAPGMAVVVVDAGTFSALQSRVLRLESDLRGDGYGVERLVVTADEGPPEVKARIAEVRARSGGRLRAAILLGRVPRPFSGLINPDGHLDHRGAWPADGYYGEFSTWTDMVNLGGTGPFANRSGDGKFDPSTYPGPLELMVGRVDAEGLPAFAPLDAQALLARYLDRNHAYRHGVERLSPRAHVRDSFGYFGGEAFSRIAWRDSAAVLGAAPSSDGDFFDVLEDAQGHALAFGCGGGTPTSAGGVGTTAHFAARAPRAAFMGLFGSYFGDWSYDDNFLRAALFSPGAVLGTSWFARPYLHLHALGALHPFGATTLHSANNAGADYDTGYSARSVHQALLGDPTLRLFVIGGPGALEVSPEPAAARLAWAAAAEQVDGYHVFRRTAGAEAEAETRLTPTPVLATAFTDATAEPGVLHDYRVVAVKKVSTGSGTFFQHSQGPRAQGGRLPAPPVADAGAVESGHPGDGGIGGPRPDPEPAGCGCANAGAGAAGWICLVLALPAVARRRRSATARPS